MPDYNVANLYVKVAYDRLHLQPFPEYQRQATSPTMSWKRTNPKWNSQWDWNWETPKRKTAAKSAGKGAKEAPYLTGYDGTKVSLRPSSWSSTPSGDNQQNGEIAEIRDFLKTIFAQGQGAVDPSNPTLQRFMQADAQSQLREEQKKLNHKRKLTKKVESLRRQIQTRESDFSEWKQGLKNTIKEEEQRHNNKIKQLQEELTKSERREWRRRTRAHRRFLRRGAHEQRANTATATPARSHSNHTGSTASRHAMPTTRSSKCTDDATDGIATSTDQCTGVEPTNVAFAWPEHCQRDLAQQHVCLQKPATSHTCRSIHAVQLTGKQAAGNTTRKPARQAQCRRKHNRHTACKNRSNKPQWLGMIPPSEGIEESQLLDDNGCCSSEKDSTSNSTKTHSKKHFLHCFLSFLFHDEFSGTDASGYQPGYRKNRNGGKSHQDQLFEDLTITFMALTIPFLTLCGIALHAVWCHGSIACRRLLKIRRRRYARRGSPSTLRNTRKPKVNLRVLFLLWLCHCPQGVQAHPKRTVDSQQYNIDVFSGSTMMMKEIIVYQAHYNERILSVPLTLPTMRYRSWIGTALGFIGAYQQFDNHMLYQIQPNPFDIMHPMATHFILEHPGDRSLHESIALVDIVEGPEDAKSTRAAWILPTSIHRHELLHELGLYRQCSPP